MRRLLKKKNGITLIVLIITVIIMLILAGVVISYIFLENSFFDKVNDASEKYTQASQDEANYINNLLSNISVGAGDMTNEELFNIINNLILRVEELENNDNVDMLQAYPIGSIYLSANETNPADLFGGTWEAYGQGRTLVGVGEGEDTRGEKLEFIINQTGGEYNHLLTINELSSHSHTLTAVTGTSTSTASYVTNYGTGSNNSSFTIYQYESTSGIRYSPKTVLTSASTATNTTSMSGNSGVHNNIQPYITCYMWKRVD